MKKAKTRSQRNPRADRDTMKREYDWTGARRGVTAARYREGNNIVVLEPGVAALFPNSNSVNDALRALGARRTKRPADRHRAS